MLIANGLYIATPLNVIIERLQEELERPLNNVKFRQGDLQCSCPFHKNGNERKPSFGLSLSVGDKGVYNCFTCGAKGTLFDFINKLFGKELLSSFGEDWIAETFGEDRVENDEIWNDLIEKDNTRYITSVIPIETQQFRYYHPYMKKRRLTEEVINIFDVGFDKETNSITFPFRDINGNIEFIVRRSVRGKFYNYPQGAIKGLYGLYEVRKYFDKPNYIYVCESIINALTLWSYHRPAIALLGTGTKEQVKMLNDLVDCKLVFCLDGDEAGDKGFAKMKDRLSPLKSIARVIMPRGKDVNDLSFEEFENCKRETY